MYAYKCLSTTYLVSRLNSVVIPTIQLNEHHLQWQHALILRLFTQSATGLIGYACTWHSKIRCSMMNDEEEDEGLMRVMMMIDNTIMVRW